MANKKLKFNAKKSFVKLLEYILENKEEPFCEGECFKIKDCSSRKNYIRRNTLHKRYTEEALLYKTQICEKYHSFCGLNE